MCVYRCTTALVTCAKPSAAWPKPAASRPLCWCSATTVTTTASTTWSDGWTSARQRRFSSRTRHRSTQARIPASRRTTVLGTLAGKGERNQKSPTVSGARVKISGGQIRFPSLNRPLCSHCRKNHKGKPPSRKGPLRLRLNLQGRRLGVQTGKMFGTSRLEGHQKVKISH